jgi:hypothetical protein
MSLIGSLEDLGLGDILQIINLSQKSGVLTLRGECGEGSIVFLDGMVRLARLKEGPEDLHGLLVGGGFVADSDFDAAIAQARKSGVAIDVALESMASITPERIDSLRRELVETAVGEMFSWTSGEFSFDVGCEEYVQSNELALSTGVNAQYLAMESLRVKDEEDDAGPNLDELSPEEMFGVVADSKDPGPATEDTELQQTDPFSNSDELTLGSESRLTDPAMEAMVQFTTDRVEPTGDGDGMDEAIIQVELIDDIDDVEDIDYIEDAADFDSQAGPILELDALAFDSPPIQAASEPTEVLNPETVFGPSNGASGEAAVEVQTASIDRASLPPVVVIDPNLPVLEWARSFISEIFPQVHIFQRSQEGLGRIRQYLARAQTPLLLVSPNIEGNPLSGIADATDFVARLRSQAPRMSVIWMISEDAENCAAPVENMPAVLHPPETSLAAGGDSRIDALGTRVVEALLESIADSRKSVSQADSGPAHASAPQSPREAASSPGLEHLKAATQELSDASNRGEVLPLVIRFAADSFRRVAMFMVRGDHVIGMAQSGLDEAGGPDDVEMRGLQFERDECAFFRDVISSGLAVRENARDAGDQRLLEFIGGASRSESYIAPIMSAEQVVALLYADNFTSEAEPGDTSALEVVLHHAGLALDRAALERALVEADSD